MPWTSRASATTRTTARSRTRSSPGKTDAGHHLDLRHDGRGRRVPAQPRQLVAGLLRQPDLRLDRQRPGREPRQHPVAESAGDHRARSDDRQARRGKTRRPATRSCTASGRRRRSARSAASMQVVHGQGDGWVRGYEAKTGKKLWEFDTNPKDSVWPKTRNEVIATPVIFDERRLHRQRPGPRARRGRRPSLRDRRHQARRHHEDGLLWHYDKIRRSISTASIKDGLIYYPDFSGFLHCLDVKTGQPSGRTTCSPRCGARRWSSTARSTSATRTATSSSCSTGARRRSCREVNMESSVYSTAITSNGVMFVMTRNQLWAIQEGAQLEEVARRNHEGDGGRFRSMKESHDLTSRFHTTDVPQVPQASFIPSWCCRIGLVVGRSERELAVVQRTVRVRRRDRRAAGDLEHREGHQRRVALAAPRYGPFEPDRLGQSCLRHHRRAGEQRGRIVRLGDSSKAGIDSALTPARTNGD